MICFFGKRTVSAVFLFTAFFMFNCTGNADDRTAIPDTNAYQDSTNHYRIIFPDSWTLVAPNMTFTLVKARAPQGYAAISVAKRESLWQDDKVSTRCKDAWDALQAVSVATFTNKFERNSSTQTPEILSVEKVTVGKEKAIKVDYFLSDTTRTGTARIRSFFVLHERMWFSISCATLKPDPDLCLAEMLQSVNTFQFYEEKR